MAKKRMIIRWIRETVGGVSGGVRCQGGSDKVKEEEGQGGSV